MFWLNKKIISYAFLSKSCFQVLFLYQLEGLTFWSVRKIGNQGCCRKSETKSNDEEQECMDEREYTLIRNGSDKSMLNFLFAHVRIQRGDRGSGPSPLKNHKNIGFSSNTGPDPSYQASIQCWAITGMPVKRHLMAFYWRADDGPLQVELGSSLPSSTKKKYVVKIGSSLTKLSGSVHVAGADSCCLLLTVAYS